MYYISITLIIIFTFLIVNHLINQIKNNTFEGLENAVSENKINNLFLSTNTLKASIKKYKKKNTDINLNLDTLEEILSILLIHINIFCMLGNSEINSKCVTV